MKMKNNFRKRSWIIGVIVFVFSAVLCVVMIASPVWAANNGITGVSYIDKALYEQLLQCYRGDAFNEGFTLFEYNQNNKGYLNPSSTTNALLITGRYHKVKNLKETDEIIDSVSCSELLFGAKGSTGHVLGIGDYMATTFDGVLPGVNGIYTMDGDSYLKFMGYETKQVNAGLRCAYFIYDRKYTYYNTGWGFDYYYDYLGNYHSGRGVVEKNGYYGTDVVCANVAANGNISSDTLTIKSLPSDHAMMIDPSNNRIMKFEASSNSLNVCKSKGTNVLGNISGWECRALGFSVGNKWSTFLSDGSTNDTSLQSLLSKSPFFEMSYTKTTYFSPDETILVPVNKVDTYSYTLNPAYQEIDETDLETVYELNMTSYASPLAAIRNISGNDSYKGYSDLRYSGEEELSLYKYYIENYYNESGSVGIICRLQSDDSAEHNGYKARVGNDLASFNMYNANTNDALNCYAKKPTKNKSNKVNGLNSSKHFTTQVSFDDIISQLNNLRISDNDVIAELLGGTMGEAADTDPDAATNIYDPSNHDTSTCRATAKSMGWLICTILGAIQDGVSRMYTDFVEPSLRIEPQLFNESSTGTKTGWDVFRNIANVLIIILFLAVIFSQLTGVGIDNYGIKKILPKLILMAVLMNLSYYICVALVDVSNIVGNGVQGLLDSLSPQVSDLSANYQGAIGSTIASVGLLAAAIGGAAWMGVFSIATLLALLPTAISVLVAIFFLFILLAARQAAIVVMVVISPLAFACFILPNTKKLFDKWVKVGEALLLVYPIAGLLVGGGDYVSRILLSSGIGNESFVSALTATLVGIVPIFFIPTLLKSSMNGLGGLGNKISGLGSRLGRGAANGVRNSEAFRNQQQRANDRRMRKMAGLKKNENGEWVDSNGLRSKFAKSGVGRALGADRTMARRRSQVEAAEHSKQMELGYNDMGILNAQRVKDENMRMSRAAEGKVGVPELNEELALQRAQAQRSSQELRNYQDQYATFSKAQLLDATKGAFGANGWLGKQDGAQRMAALMGAMINNGMENQVFGMLREDKNGEIARNASVMQMLAGVKEKGLKAYGKMGNGVSYESFMKDVVDVLDDDGKPTGRKATLMQQYIDKKGNEFYNDLSDKTLRQIQWAGGMTNGQLLTAASRLQSQDAINVVDEILVERAKQAAETGTPLKFTGEQLASFSPSTVAELNKSAVGQQAIVEASQDLLRNTKLQSKVDTESRQIIDQLRGMTGQSEIWEPGEKIVRQRDASALEGGGSIRQETVASQDAATARAQQAASAEAEPVTIGDSSYAREVVMEAAGAPVTGGSTISPAPWATGTTGINELLSMVPANKTSSDYGRLEDAIMNYQGSDFAMTPEQLKTLPISTVSKLAGSANTTHTQALLDATDKMDAATFGALNPVVKETLNALRARNGKPRL